MNNTKRIFLCLSMLLTIILGFLIRLATNEIYRYQRFITFNEASKHFKSFYTTYQQRIVFLWIAWGVLLVSLMIQLLLEFKKKS